MSPLTMSKASSITLTMGTKQLVVHEAFETTMSLLGVEVVVVDADDEGGVGVARRGRDDDPLHRAAQVAGGVGPAGEDARWTRSRRRPRACPRAAASGSRSARTRMCRSPTSRSLPSTSTGTGSRPVGRVVAQQVGQRLGRGQVVDPDDLDVGARGQDRRAGSCARCARSR